MRFTSSILVAIAAFAGSGNTHVSGHLRSSTSSNDPIDGEQPQRVKAALYMTMEGPQDECMLQDGTADIDSLERKTQATMEKYGPEDVNYLVDDEVPGYEIYPKEGIGYVDESTTQAIIESPIKSVHDTEGYDNNFEVKIVGGDVSDPNEFPYFGTWQYMIALSYHLEVYRYTHIILHDVFDSHSSLNSPFRWLWWDTDWTRYRSGSWSLSWTRWSIRQDRWWK